jgi:hypothetical protein
MTSMNLLYLKRRCLNLRKLSKHAILKKKIKKDQIKVLVKKVETLQKPKSSKNDNSEETTTVRLKCRKCDETFPSIKSLKRHVSPNHTPKIECNDCDTNHTPKIECNDCDKIFSKNYDLEVHIKTDHKPRELHKCDKCDKQFMFKWRLVKQKKKWDACLLLTCANLTKNVHGIFVLYDLKVLKKNMMTKKMRIIINLMKMKLNPVNLVMKCLTIFRTLLTIIKQN